MKKVLSIIAVALTVALVFTSCKKEPTRTELLTNEKGWTLSALTCPQGYGVNAVTDIYAMLDNAGGYECDDVIYFRLDGNEYVNYGIQRYAYEPNGTIPVGTWVINCYLECQLPLFGPRENDPGSEPYSPEKELCEIISLEADRMELRYTFMVADSFVNGQFNSPGVWTFILTYVPAN